MNVPTIWLNYHPDVCHNMHMWDQTMVKDMLDQTGAEHHVMDDTGPDWPLTPAVTAAVVVIPGRFHTTDIPRINTDLARLDRVLVIVTSDEESAFPYEQLTHPQMRLWVMTPRPGRGPADRYLGEGWQPGTHETLRAIGPRGRDLPWSFSGQVNHPRRHQMMTAAGRLTGELAATPERFARSGGFTQGLSQADYLERLARSKIALAPGGPATPDSFRLYESLEAGCLPFAGAHCSAYNQPGYWELLLAECPPWVVVYDWEALPGLLNEALDRWPANANQAWAWWIRYKRDLHADLVGTVAWATNLPVVQSPVTVLIPTSPIPSHPDTRIVETTVSSVRERLPDAEIILMVDGIRPEQEHRRGDYDEYVHRLLWFANFEWGRTYPLVFTGHRHQAGMTRAALGHVRSPLVLFVEHDTPLEGDVPFDDLARPILEGHADLIRLHHESEVLGVHRHLMLDDEPRDVSGVPMMRTIQWSQRPHLASTAYYRDIMSHYFGHDACTMIEDVMHGVVKNRVEADPLAWNRHRLWMYTPEGNIRRSHHTDGRGPDPKYDMTFAYDGPTPEGAPSPGRR